MKEISLKMRTGYKYKAEEIEVKKEKQNFQSRAEGPGSVEGTLRGEAMGSAWEDVPGACSEGIGPAEDKVACDLKSSIISRPISPKIEKSISG